MPFRAAANGSLSAACATFVSEAPRWRKPARQKTIARALYLTFPRIILLAAACQQRIARPRGRSRSTALGSYLQFPMFIHPSQLRDSLAWLTDGEGSRLD